MKNPRPLWPRFVSYYPVVSSIVLNSLLLFIVLNVGAQVYLDVKACRAKYTASSGVPMAHREYHPSLAPVYPGMDESQVAELIIETRKLSLEYDAYTQFKERPANGKYVKVDPNGFRESKNQTKWPPDRGTFTIFVFGGSTTFGYRVADDSTIPSHLQELIRTETDLPVAVYNFGRGGYISAQERVLFEKLLLQGYVPHMAIFIDGLNDFSVADGEPIYTGDLKRLMDKDEASQWDRFIRELPVTRALLMITSKGEREDGKRQDTENLSRKQESDKAVKRILERYHTNKKMITATAKAFDVVPVFVWQPVPVHEYDQRYNIFGKFNYDRKAPLIAPGYRLMAAENQSGPVEDNFIWCADIQTDAKKPLYVDAVHYSGEMSGLIARCIFNDLKQRGMLIHRR